MRILGTFGIDSAYPFGTSAYLARFEQNTGRGSHAYYLLRGDLNQMGIMESRLREAGFPVTRSQSGTYPGFREADHDKYVEALKYLFQYRVPGWGNQKMVEEGVCTQDEFQQALDEECKRSRPNH